MPKIGPITLLKIRKFAAMRALKRPSPSMIPITGETAFGRNYRSLSLGTPECPELYSVREALSEGFSCWRFDPATSNRSEEVVPYSRLAELELYIREYYRRQELHHPSALVYLWSRATGRHLRDDFSDRAVQFFYNRRTLVRDDRMDLLKDIFEKTVADPRTHITEVTLMTDRYGMRWVWHQENQAARSYIRLLLSSMAAAGSLQAADGGSYKLAALGLTHLHEFELEERRHQDAKRQQSAVIWLTLVLAVITAFQAWPTIKDFLTTLSASYGTS